MIIPRWFSYPSHSREYYIVRYGNFATNGNIKLMYGLLSVALSIDDYWSEGSVDCFRILIGSTTIWTIVEHYLHKSGTRVIKPMQIHICGTRYNVPIYGSLVIQGLQEGGLITTLGLYFGDRIDDPASIILFHMFLLLSIISVCAQKNLVRSSRRMVNTRASLTFIFSITAWDLYSSICLYRDHLTRQIRMFAVMVYFSAWWTCATWWIGSRQVEVRDNSTNQGDIIIKSAVDTFMVLSYDVIFEIGFAYLIFYNLFICSS